MPVGFRGRQGKSLPIEPLPVFDCRLPIGSLWPVSVQFDMDLSDTKQAGSIEPIGNRQSKIGNV